MGLEKLGNDYNILFWSNYEQYSFMSLSKQRGKLKTIKSFQNKSLTVGNSRVACQSL